MCVHESNIWDKEKEKKSRSSYDHFVDFCLSDALQSRRKIVEAQLDLCTKSRHYVYFVSLNSYIKILYALNQREEKTTSWRSSHKLSIALEREKKRRPREKKRVQWKVRINSNPIWMNLVYMFRSYHPLQRQRPTTTTNNSKIRTRNVELSKYFALLSFAIERDYLFIAIYLCISVKRRINARFCSLFARTKTIFHSHTTFFSWDSFICLKFLSRLNTHPSPMPKIAWETDSDSDSKHTYPMHGCIWLCQVKRKKIIAPFSAADVHIDVLKICVGIWLRSHGYGCV